MERASFQQEAAAVQGTVAASVAASGFAEAACTAVVVGCHTAVAVVEQTAAFAVVVDNLELEAGNFETAGSFVGPFE
jgi:hypothetical protein